MRNQLIKIFLLFGIIPAILLTILIVWLSAEQARVVLQEQASEKLVAQREAKKSEIESYFGTLAGQVKTFSNDRMVIDAMKEFKYAFSDYRDDAMISIGNYHKQSLVDFYTQQFEARYKSRNAGKGFDIKNTIAQLDDDSIALQYSYISNNPEALGEKDALMSASDNSVYSQRHKNYHPHFRAYLQEFGYYDIFLVDADSGDIVYSVFKELDYSTSLKSGPYADSGIGRAFQQANAATEADSVALIDFAPYSPSYEDPAAFIASPIFDNGRKVGVLIFQMPVDRLNEIMTYGEKWADAGMGASGETYLVADDFTMRSMGRFLVDDKAGYLQILKESGFPDKLITTIDEKETTLGLQPVKSIGVEAALSGTSGFSIFNDYRDISVLSAYAPINVKGLDWVILSEIDEEEAFAPVASLVQTILAWSVGALLIIGALTAVIGFKFATIFVTPLQYITGALTYMAKDIEKGNVDLTQPLAPPGNSQLANRMAGGINTVLDKFSAVLKELSEASLSISSSTQQVSSLSEESNQNMETQRSETDMVATAITELSASSQEVARNAQLGAEAAKNADSDTKAGAETVNEAVSTISELAESLTSASSVIHGLEEDSENIGSVLSVIQSIAEQTNLLALNAAIEAARAGEQGRGFAVVADEVRTLAARTQDATQEIKVIIEQLQTRSKDAVSVMDEGCEKANFGLEKAVTAGNALSNIEGKVADIDNMNAMIASAAQEQCNVAEEVTQNIVRISQLTEQTTDGTMQTSQASGELLQLAIRLQELASQFKVK